MATALPAFTRDRRLATLLQADAAQIMGLNFSLRFSSRRFQACRSHIWKKPAVSASAVGFSIFWGAFRLTRPQRPQLLDIPQLMEVSPRAQASGLAYVSRPVAAGIKYLARQKLGSAHSSAASIARSPLSSS